MVVPVLTQLPPQHACARRHRSWGAAYGVAGSAICDSDRQTSFTGNHLARWLAMRSTADATLTAEPGRRMREFLRSSCVMVADRWSPLTLNVEIGATASVVVTGGNSG